MAALLIDFARTGDALAGTTKKLQKQALLADYFIGIPEADDLRRAVRFAGGRTFAATDERVTGVSGAILTDVIRDLLNLDPVTFRATAIRHGELGEAIGELWPSAGQAITPTLTLQMLSDAFDTLAMVASAELKKPILQQLYARCVAPREAAYLTKIITGDLRTGVQEGVLQASIARAFASALADVQRAHLIVGDSGDVAVLARAGQLASATFQLFHPIQFMLATPQETADDAALTIADRIFFAEDKLDGIRAQVHKSHDRVAIYTRTMDRTDASFPDVVEQVRKIPGEFLLDGEIVPWRNGQVLPFQHIQRRLGRKVLTPKMLKDNPAIFIAFDILYREGQSLLDFPFRERREALQDLLADDVFGMTRIHPVKSSVDIDRAFVDARERKNEGLILKDAESVYSPGKRGKMWLKLKTHLPTLDCVVTAAEYGHGKRRGTLSDYTFAVWDRDPGDTGRLVNIGKAFSGVTDEEIAQLTELFLKISTSNDGRVFQVAPQVVLEIAADQVQRSTRHASGYALRFPRVKRIRWDKKPEDADRLAQVVQTYESSVNFARGAPDLKPAPVSDPGLFDSL